MHSDKDMNLIDPRGSKLIGFLLLLLASLILHFFQMGDKTVWTSYLYIVIDIGFLIKEEPTPMRFLLFTIDKLLAVFKNRSHMELKLSFICHGLFCV